MELPHSGYQFVGYHFGRIAASGSHAIDSPLGCVLGGNTVCAPVDRSSTTIGDLLPLTRNCSVSTLPVT